MKRRDFSDDAFAIYNFASAEECADWIAMAEEVGFDEAPIETGAGSVVAKDARNNLRIMFDNPSLAQEFWASAKGFVPPVLGDWRAVGVNERFRFYRYDEAHVFHWHTDGRFCRNECEESRLTFMVYLNSDFEGGFTDFGDFKVWPETGMALFFAHHLKHEGAVVTSGRKYVMRSDVMYRRV